jgi:hypothetical protein
MLAEVVMDDTDEQMQINVEDENLQLQQENPQSDEPTEYNHLDVKKEADRVNANERRRELYRTKRNDKGQIDERTNRIRSERVRTVESIEKAKLRRAELVEQRKEQLRTGIVPVSFLLDCIA